MELLTIGDSRLIGRYSIGEPFQFRVVSGATKFKIPELIQVDSLILEISTILWVLTFMLCLKM